MRTLMTILLLAVAVVFIGCDLIADSQLENAVKKALADDSRTSQFSFEVSVQDDGSILITGEVYKGEDIEAVTEIAQAVKGVERVVNRTKIPEEGGGMVQDHVVPSPFL